jgi:hypothetical protein
VTTVVKSVVGRCLDCYINSQQNQGIAEERNRSHPLSLSVNDQQPLDMEVSARDLTLVCTREWNCESPKVLKDISIVDRGGGRRTVDPVLVRKRRSPE